MHPDLCLHDLEGVPSPGKERPVAVDERRLPGKPLRGRPDRATRAVVNGQVRGVLARPGVDPVPERPIWILDSAALDQIGWVARSVGCVFAGVVPRGPVVQVATMLGRPCACLPPGALPAPGTRVALDGTRGTVTVAQ